MSIIEEKDRRAIQDKLMNLSNPVKIINFTQELECMYCRETRQLMEELASMSDKISFEVYDFQNDTSRVEEFRIDKIPATVIMGKKDYGVRFYGIPAGYEFNTVLDALAAISRGDSGLNPLTREKLKEVEQPLHIQVLVTPT
jgi:glutaredoxin-like protein